MIHYLKKAFIRRNLDDLCEFIHEQIDEVDLEVDKMVINKYSGHKISKVQKDYTVKSRFITDKQHDPKAFNALFFKMTEILKDTPLHVYAKNDKRYNLNALYIGVDKSWLEQKDIVNSLNSLAGITKFSL